MLYADFEVSDLQVIAIMMYRPAFPKFVHQTDYGETPTAKLVGYSCSNREA